MAKNRTRKVHMQWSPSVSVSGQSIKVESGSWAGKTRYECGGELDIWCAAYLVRELRRALRKIRDEEYSKLNGQVNRAEGEL